MICPNCHNEQKVTEQHYGALYTCTSCQAVYFINFDGQPEYGEASGDDYANAKLELENLQLESAPPAVQQPLGAEIGSLEPLVPTNEIVQPTDNFEAFVPPIANPTEVPSIDSPFDFQNNLSGMNSDLTQTQIDQQFKQKQAVPPSNPTKTPVKNTQASGSFANIAQEISDFANTDSQLSGLNYDLVVSGIDTQETKSLFKEAIEDSKFAWDAFEIMKSLKNGRVEIRRMSPAKAFLLAKRIQFLDVDKSWKQNAGT